MMHCQFKRGFFTFRSCDRPAVKQCENCGQAACPFHLSVQSGLRFCVDCAAQQNNQVSSDYYEDDWVYSYRNSYYRSGYRPFLYSQQDYRSFDSYGDEDDETDNYDDDYAGGDFSDS